MLNLNLSPNDGQTAAYFFKEAAGVWSVSSINIEFDLP